MNEIVYKEYNYVKNNSFEKATINLSFKDSESQPLVKIGSSVKKGEIIAGGDNLPKIYAPFDSKVKDFKKINTGDNLVSSHIELERERNDFPYETISITNIESPMDFLKKIYEYGVIDCQENSNIFKELSKKIEKIENLIINFYDYRLYNFTGKYFFLNKKEEIISIINLMDKIFNFKTIKIIYDNSQQELLGDYKKAFNDVSSKIKFISVKNNLDYNVRLKLKLLSPILTTEYFSNHNTLYLDSKTLLDIHTVCINNQKINYTYFTINGDAINNIGIYKMPIGISIKEIIELAQTKNSYDYVDNYMYNAMEAYNDEMAFEKEIEEETDEYKKQKLQKLLQEKTEEANEKIYSKRMDMLKYYNQCLGLVYEIKGNKKFEIFSQNNVVTPSTNAIIMLTRESARKK